MINLDDLLPIPDCGGYFISQCGMFLYDKRKGGFLKYFKVGGKYMVSLSNVQGCYRKMFSVHSLVLNTWREFPTDVRKYCRFKDGNVLNVHVDNLEWVSKKESMRGVVKVVRKKTKKLMSKSKRGVNHPKFKGYYLIEGRRFNNFREIGRHFKKSRTWAFLKFNSGISGWEFVSNVEEVESCY